MNSELQNSQTNIDDEDPLSINFHALIKVFREEKFKIFLILFFFILIGTVYAFTAREEFISKGKILPEISGGGNSSLGGLANLVGIGGFELGLKNNTDAIRPDIYPDVLSSTPFFLNLFSQKFISKSGDSISFERYYHMAVEENETFKENILSTFKGRPKGTISFNLLTEQRIKDLKSRIIVSLDKKSGVLSISTKMPDPVIAAQISGYAMIYLTDYVSDYRTEKLKQEVDFLGRKVSAAKGEYYKDQTRKANYADKYSAPTIRMQSADIQRERIESDYKLSANVYQELLKKFEEAKIKLQQETPVFQILEPPVVPNLKVEPDKGIILGIFGVIGLLCGVIFSLIINKNYNKVFA